MGKAPPKSVIDCSRTEQLSTGRLQWDLVILHTTDGGQHWVDVSGELNRVKGDQNDSAYNIYAVEPAKAIVLTFNGGKFIYTSDSGRSWMPVAALPEEPPQAFLGQFGVLGDNELWAVGGADSIEGMWGTLARMSADCRWTKYGIGGIFFTDAIFCTLKEVITCGAIPTPGHESPRDDRDGVMLSSSDEGRNWTIIYRNSQVPVINSLARADANNIWAVGKRGAILHLRPAILSLAWLRPLKPGLGLWLWDKMPSCPTLCRANAAKLRIADLRRSMN